MVRLTEPLPRAARRGPVVDAATVMERCDALQEHTEEPGKLTRLFATPALEAATAAVEGWMRDAGLTTRRDARAQPVRPLRGIAARRAGLPARLAPRLRARRRPLRRPARRAHRARRRGAPGGARRATAVRARGVRVLRRGVRALRHRPTSAPRRVAGAFDEAWLDRVDRDGITMRDAMRAIGGDPDDIASCARDAASTVGWLELHIEQGPALESGGPADRRRHRHPGAGAPLVGDPRHRRPRGHDADGRPQRRARRRRRAGARDRGDRPRDARPGRDGRHPGRRAGRDERHPRPRRADLRHPPPGRRARSSTR